MPRLRKNVRKLPRTIRLFCDLLPLQACFAQGFGSDVLIPAHDRMRLKRLLRYAGRPPVAAERLSLLGDGRLLYRLKRRWPGGTTHMIFEPLNLVEKLAALLPPPRFNLVRYSGVLACASAKPRPH